MSQHGRDFEKQGFSYMDGVPVKIGEKYKPPKKYNLPVGFLQKLPTDTITEQYDFLLERSVLEKISEWRKIRKDAAEARWKRIEAEDKLIQENADKLKEIGSPTKADVSAADDENSAQPQNNSCSDNPETVTEDKTDLTCAHSVAVQSSEEVSSCSNAVVTVHGQIVTSQSNQYAMPNSILTPTPYGPFLNQKKDYQLSPFNLSDFEADTSSPFDNMELKTINDMEELAHVLQPMSTSTKTKETGNPPPYSYYTPNVQGNQSNVQISTPLSSVHQLCSSDIKTLPQVNGITSYSLYGTVPRTQIQPVSQLKNSDMQNVSYSAFGGGSYQYPVNSMENSAFTRASAYDYYMGQPWDHKTTVVNTSTPRFSHIFPPSKGNAPVSGSSGATPSGPYLRPSENMDNNNMYTYPVPSPYFTPQMIPSHSNNDKAVAAISSDSGGLRASKSVPDIMKELESELNKQPVQQVPRRTNCVATPSGQSIPKELENWSPWPNLDSPDNSPSSPLDSAVVKSDSGNSKVENTTAKYVTTLPNPFFDLPPTAQRLVQHISEMGFSLARVARACQIFGEDDKKIVEFLLQVQSLEEQNYPGDLAEQSLISSNYDEKECVNYMNLVGQLKDLGFTESQVIQALKINENDGDKALDYLVS